MQRAEGLSSTVVSVWLTDDQWLVETWFGIEMEVVWVGWYDRHYMGNTL